MLLFAFIMLHFQVEHLRPALQSGAPYKSTLDALVTIVHYQGWKQLFAGLSINYIKVKCLSARYLYQ